MFHNLDKLCVFWRAVYPLCLFQRFIRYIYLERFIRCIA
jgi:hypothetical protein